MDDEQPEPPVHDEDAAERAGRMTTTIPRPTNRRASDAGRPRVGDVRRGARTDRISSHRSAWLFGLAALVIAGAIGAALFGLPVRTWFDQDDQIGALEHELAELQEVNDDLQGEVDRLQTDDGIREAAREELGQVQAGEQRRTVLDLPLLPRDLPAGWPYSQVDQILTMREAEAAAPATSAAPAAASAAPADEPEEADEANDPDEDAPAALFQPIPPPPPPTTAVAESTTTTPNAASPPGAPAASTTTPGAATAAPPVAPPGITSPGFRG